MNRKLKMTLAGLVCLLITFTGCISVSADWILWNYGSITGGKYTGYPFKPTVQVSDTLTAGWRLLEEGTDYDLVYAPGTDYINPGRVSVTLIGKGKYEGRSGTDRYAIFSTNIDGTDGSPACAVVGEVPDQVYTGEEIRPVPEVTWNGITLDYKVRFSVTYADNINVGTAKFTVLGEGPLDGKMPPSSFRIVPADLAGASVTVPDQTHTGSALTPKPVVTFNGRTLVEGTDYTITGYSNNVEASDTKPAVKLKGKGNFKGSVTKSFRIKPVSVASVKLSKTSVKMLANKTVTLKATVSPSNATNQSVTWKSSDKTIATVSSTGKVTGKKGGKVTITATTADGKKTAKCEVQVFNKIRVPLQDGKYYLFTSKLGNFCMTVPDNSKKAGTSLVLIKQNLSGWQKFKVKKVTKDGADYYALINKNSGLAVTWVKGGDFVQKKYTGANAQLFFAMRYGDNSLQLINKLTNKAIGLPGGKAVRKANVGAVKFGAGLEQRWINAVSSK